MNVHLPRRLVVDRNADGAPRHRRIANRQFAGRRQAGELDSLAGIRQRDRGAPGSARISQQERPANAGAFFRFKRLCFGSNGRNGSRK